jgi:hypothetical protein
MSKLVDRMIRAARLDAALYEEVEAEEGAIVQAMTVVVIFGLATGIGNLSDRGLIGLLEDTSRALLAWYFWALLTYLIGTRILPGPHTESDMGELLRTIGFSSSPGIILLFALIPPLKPFVFSVVIVWMLIAMIVAVRQALDYSSTLRALGVCLIGWLIPFTILWFIFSIDEALKIS